MSIARKILEETNEDITGTDLYKIIRETVPNIVDGLEDLSSQIVSNSIDKSTLINLINDVDKINVELNKEGFTYFPQPNMIDKSLLPDVFSTFEEFYNSYMNGFDTSELEILNTNTKDLVFILDRLKQAM